MRLKNKVAVVTGAASGIGQEIAQEFLREGASVLLSDIKGKRTGIIPEEFRDNSDFVKSDVSKSGQVKKLVNKALSKWGRLDIMVNNAGIGSSGGVLDEKDGNWSKVLGVNLDGVFFGTREAARVMKEKKIKGSIINMSSILGSVGLPGAVAYCSAKGGVEQLTRASSLDLASYKIRVNAVAPGFIETEMTKDVLKDKSFGKMVKSNTPLAHVGDVKDIAKAVVYLASDESGYVTGETLHVDGGWTAR